MSSIRTAAALLLLPLFAACAVPGHVASVQTADRLEELRVAVETLKSAAGSTVTTLQAVIAAKDQDPSAAFHEFESSVRQLESARKRAESRLNGLRSEANAYFATWREESAKISDPDLKERSEERRAELAEAVDDVESSMKAPRDSITVYQKSLDDTLTFLSIDLTASGISSVEGRAKSASKSIKALDEELDDVLTAIRKAAPQFASARATSGSRKSTPAADEERSSG